MRREINIMAMVLSVVLFLSCGSGLVRRVSRQYQGGIHGLLYWKNRHFPLKQTRVTVVRLRPSVGREYEVRTSDSGQFILLGLAPGEYLIRACIEGKYNFSRLLRVRVHDGDMTAALFPIGRRSLPKWHPDHWGNPFYPVGLSLRTLASIPEKGNPFRDNLRMVRGLLTGTPDTAREKKWYERMKQKHRLPLQISPHHALIVYCSAQPPLIRHGKKEYRRVSFLRRPGSRLWFYLDTYKKDAILEYKLTTMHEEWLIDPANPSPIRLGDIGRDNCRLIMAGQTDFRLFFHDTAVPHGKLVVHTFTNTIGKTHLYRRVFVYLPPGYSDGSVQTYRTVYMLDGQMHMSMHITNVLDNLIARKRIPPCIFIMPEMNRMRNGIRYLEYAAPAILEPEMRARRKKAVRFFIRRMHLPEWIGRLPEMHNAFIVNKLIPFMDSRYRTVKAASGRVIIGQSYGALAALYIGSRRNAPFSGFACQSQSGFIVPVSRIRKRVYVSFGRWECKNHKQELRELGNNFSRKKGYVLKTNVFTGAHSPIYWELELGRIVRFLFSK